MYLNSNVNLNPALSIKNLFVDATKKVSTSFVEYKPVLSVDTARNFKLYKIHIIDKEYYLPDNYFYDKADIDAAIILCKKQILNFLGTRSISSGTYVIDYLDTPPLHTIFVANLLKNCKIIRFCKNTEEAGYLRLLCQYNSIENIGIITPDVAKSEVFEKMKYLTDTLIFPIQKVDFKDVSFKDILILGSSNRLDVDVNINFLLANSSLTCSLFYVENNLIQNSWRLSKPSNIYSFNPSNSFSRSEFETGAHSFD